MKIVQFAIMSALLLPVVGGCENSKAIKKRQRIENVAKEIQYNKTVANYAEVFSSREIVVEGYGLVMGLNGKGSAECPPTIREYLIKFIQQQIDTQNRREAAEILDSDDSAAVKVYGVIPAGSSKGDRFDVAVKSLPNTQTISLEGGILFGCNLTAKSRVGIAGAKTLAKAEGPVYLDLLTSKSPDKLKGVVIGGGTAHESPIISIGLFEPNYLLANIIRNRINQRFGENTAVAKNPELILLNPPEAYKGKHAKFAKLVRHLYIPENDKSENERINALAANLGIRNEIVDSEIGLEAIGRHSLTVLKQYLNDKDEYVKLRAARCMINLGDERAVQPLKEIASNAKSPYRIEAINAIGEARRKLVISSLSKFLNDYDFKVRLAAQKQLERVKDISITETFVARSFIVKETVSTAPSVIYVQRRVEPGIVIFGQNVKCKENIFITSDNKEITINSVPGAGSISIMRKHPTKPGIVGPIKSDYQVMSLIQTLCEPLNTQGSKYKKQGLGVPFSEAVSLLKKMCESGVIDADFVAEPLEDIDSLVLPQRGI